MRRGVFIARDALPWVRGRLRTGRRLGFVRCVSIAAGTAGTKERAEADEHHYGSDGDEDDHDGDSYKRRRRQRSVLVRGARGASTTGIDRIISSHDLGPKHQRELREIDRAPAGDRVPASCRDEATGAAIRLRRDAARAARIVAPRHVIEGRRRRRWPPRRLVVSVVVERRVQPADRALTLSVARGVHQRDEGGEDGRRTRRAVDRLERIADGDDILRADEGDVRDAASVTIVSRSRRRREGPEIRIDGRLLPRRRREVRREAAAGRDDAALDALARDLSLVCLGSLRRARRRHVRRRRGEVREISAPRPRTRRLHTNGYRYNYIMFLSLFLQRTNRIRRTVRQ